MRMAIFSLLEEKKGLFAAEESLSHPGEIECVINSHPRVQESAVIGVSSGLGSEEEKVEAYVYLKPDERVSA
jgi:acyl-coenzyme A synthetase/AMP-(fatty) acid ligase